MTAQELRTSVEASVLGSGSLVGAVYKARNGTSLMKYVSKQMWVEYDTQLEIRLVRRSVAGVIEFIQK